MSLLSNCLNLGGESTNPTSKGAPQPPLKRKRSGGRRSRQKSRNVEALHAQPQGGGLCTLICRRPGQGLLPLPLFLPFFYLSVPFSINSNSERKITKITKLNGLPSLALPHVFSVTSLRLDRDLSVTSPSGVDAPHAEG